VPTTILGPTYYVGRGVLSRGGTYDLAADGRRFLMLKQAGDRSQLKRTADPCRSEELGRRIKAVAAAATVRLIGVIHRRHRADAR
jgi:hypothetical protein